MAVSKNEKKYVQSLTSLSTPLDRTMAIKVFNSLYTEEEQTAIKTVLEENAAAMGLGRNRSSAGLGVMVLEHTRDKVGWGYSRSIGKRALKNITDIVKLQKDIESRLADRNITTIKPAFFVGMRYQSYGQPSTTDPARVGITLVGTLPSTLDQVAMNRRQAANWRSKYKAEIAQMQEQINTINQFLGDE